MCTDTEDKWFSNPKEPCHGSKVFPANRETEKDVLCGLPFRWMHACVPCSSSWLSVMEKASLTMHASISGGGKYHFSSVITHWKFLLLQWSWVEAAHVATSSKGFNPTYKTHVASKVLCFRTIKEQTNQICQNSKKQYTVLSGTCKEISCTAAILYPGL